jgi:uncharacterized membrane protein
MATHSRGASFIAIVKSFGLGLGVMYFLDPDRGRRRRAMVRDAVVGTYNDVAEGIEGAVRDSRNRLQGLVAETGAAFRGEEVSGPQLAERVRAKLGRVTAHASAIEVGVQGNEVTLSGPVLVHELEDVLDAVTAVRGVMSVVNRLAVHATPENVPELEGGGVPRTGRRSEPRRRNWAPATCLAAGVAGGSLLASGLRSSGPLGALVGTLGLGLLARAVTNLDARRLLGVGESRRGIDLHKTLTIDAPIEHVYRAWSDIQSFPSFMRNVKEVRDLGEDRWRWTVAGPLGTPVQFTARVTRQEPNKVVAWKSDTGAAVAHAGIVRFTPTVTGGTRVDLRMTYKPPFGAAGHLVASLFGADPKSEMDEDLLRMKTVLEAAKSPGDAVA